MTEYNYEHFPFPSFVFLFVARVMASAGKDLKGSVFLEALAEREEANKNGRMAVSYLQTCTCRT